MGKQETPLPFLFMVDFIHFLIPMIDKKTLIDLAEAYLQDSPNYLVDVLVGSGNVITIEIDNDEGVDINDCAALSRHLESILDRDTEDFELTVTSVGLTSPSKHRVSIGNMKGKR